MASDANDDTAAARDKEVAELHPAAARHHVRATLPARFVLRSIEVEERTEKVPVVGHSFLTAVVDGGEVVFYGDASPARKVAVVPASRITDVTTTKTTEMFSLHLWPLLRLSISEEASSPVDMDLELYELTGDELHQLENIDAEVEAWKTELGAH